MARAQATDPLHNFRFHVRQLDPDYEGDILERSDIIGDGEEAGFQSCTGPEMTVEWVDYREGIKTYTEKYPGIPTVNDLTMGRGATRAGSSFFDWLLAAIEGRGYRMDLEIIHIHRVNWERAAQAQRGRGSDGYSTGVDFTNNARIITCYNAGPGRVKVAADLDATSGDVNLKEIDVVYERFDVLPIEAA